MGPRGGDELNLILPGRNYGWPLVSDGKNYDGVADPRPSTRPDFEPPKLWWNPSISPASLLIYYRQPVSRSGRATADRRACRARR